jgi:hypothetical protein
MQELLRGFHGQRLKNEKVRRLAPEIVPLQFRSRQPQFPRHDCRNAPNAGLLFSAPIFLVMV